MLEESHHSNSATLSKYVESDSEAIVITDTSLKKILLCNQKAVETFGYTKAQLESKSIGGLECNVGETLRYIQRGMNKGEHPFSFMCKYVTSSGYCYNYSVICNHFTINNIDFFSLSFRKMEGQEVLKLSNGGGSPQVFESFFEGSTMPTLILDFDTLKVLNANQAAKKLFDMPFNQLVGTYFSEYAISPPHVFNSSFKAFIEKGYTGLELTLCTSPNVCIDVEVFYTLFNSSTHKYLLCFLVNVTSHNWALTELRNVKNNLNSEISLQTKDLLRISNSLIEQIANRQKAEDQLKKSQEMFRLVFQNNPSCMVLVDANSDRVTEVNKRFTHTFEFEQEEVEDKSLKELGVFSDFEQYKEIRHEYRGKMLDQRVSLNMVSKSGKPVIAIYCNEVIQLQQGEFLLEVFHDVTELAAIQRKLAIREEQYRNMFNNSLVGVVRTSPDTGIIAACNRQFALMLGFENEADAVGKCFNSFFSNQKERKRFVKRLHDNQQLVAEFEMTTIAGKRIWVVDQAAGMTSDKQFLDEGLLDITDRKLMEDLLAMNERRFRNMIENVSDLILVVNPEGKFLYVSPSVYKELGYSLDEFLKNSILHYIDSKDREKISGILRGDLTMDGYYEISVKHCNGQFIVYEFRVSQLDEHNAHEGIVFNARNISERVKARNELQLNLQREQELNRQKSQFISTVSHEFKTPITTISLNMQMLSNNISQGQQDKVQVNIDRIASAEKRLIALLNEVTLIGRDQSGMLQFNPEPWDLHLLLDDILEHISYLILPNVEVIVQKGDSRQVFMDKSLLLHIVGNLLSNAVKYTPKESKVVYNMTVQGNELEIIVKDHGVGIPAKELEFLFQPYFRASNSKDYKGSGLGLSIVKRCVDLHGGIIHIESKENRGTTARCTIPFEIDNAD